MRTTAADSRPETPRSARHTATRDGVTPVPQSTAGRPGGSRRQVAYAFSIALAVFTAATTIPMLVAPDLLNGPAVMVGSARGTAAVMLLLGLPVLGIALVADLRGRAWAEIVWLGAVAYLLYNAVMMLLGLPFNVLFPLFVATFSLALWSTVLIVGAIDLDRLGDKISPTLRRRPIAIFAWVIVAGNTAVWLRGLVPGLANSADPEFLRGTGLTNFPTYLQDFSVWLPLMAVAAYWLWRGAARGFLVVGALLVMWILEGIGVAVDQTMGHAADPLSTVVAPELAPGFLVLSAVTLVPVLVMLRALPHHNRAG